MNENELILDGTKLAWHKNRVEAWLRGEKIAPITIDCALTTACDYGCIYCYKEFQKNQGKQSVTRDSALRFLDDAAEIGVKGVSFVSDGESTCVPYIYEAIQYGKRNGIDMAMGTHGARLKKERLGEIIPSLTYLRFNISAGEPQRYAEIHRVPIESYEKVMENIRESVRIKRERGLDITLGLQMVLMPEFRDQILPLARLGRELGVDYLVIKHCSDNEDKCLGIDYSKYDGMVDLLKQAESLSAPGYLVRAKWSKLMSGAKRRYDKCYGPAFIMQFSGTGLVAPCGILFGDKFRRYHIGNINDESFKDIWQSPRYQEVLDFIASDGFDPKTQCGDLCLQHKVNEYLWDLKQGRIKLEDPIGERPMHVNFI